MELEGNVLMINLKIMTFIFSRSLIFGLFLKFYIEKY